jgi:hypothetical protein
MVQSRARTIADYLRELPVERRAVIKSVHQQLLKTLPRGYVATMNWGMISYEVPLSTYPVTYNGQPLSFGGLAAQKNFYALYLMCFYQNQDLEQKLQAACAAQGKKLNMGKCCIRFKSLDELPLAEICKFIRPFTPAKFIACYEAAREIHSKPSKPAPSSLSKRVTKQKVRQTPVSKSSVKKPK